MTGADWLSYSLQDFLMFSPEVFLRLYVRLNQDIWPGQAVFLLVALTVPWLLTRRKQSLRRGGIALVALTWISCGFGFLWHYYGEINWPAVWFGGFFVAQGLLMASVALVSTISAIPDGRKGTVWLVVGWLSAALFLPWLTVLQSGQVQALAFVGLFPGTTVAAGSLALVLVPRPWRWPLLLLPLAWALFSAATYWTLQLHWLQGFPVATLISIGLALWLSPRPAQSPDRRSAHRDPTRR